MTSAIPRIIAHRGFAGVAPENTLGAFRAVADGIHPADMVELDVRPCADGTPVVFHDSRLGAGGDRRGITNASGVVRETPCETVREATVLDTEETIPTLAEALAVLPPEIGVNVELKHPSSIDTGPGEALDSSAVAARRERWDPFVDRVLEGLDGSENELLVSSFHEPALASVRDAAPDLPIAVLVGDSLADGLTVAERYDCEAIHPPVESVLGAHDFRGPAEHSTGESDPARLFETAAALGAAVNVWTVRTWHEAAQLAAVGVDGLIADYPGLLGFSLKTDR